MKHLRLATLLALPLQALAADPYPNMSGTGFPPDPKAAWHQGCMKAKDARIPEADLPKSPPNAKCDATDLYYSAASPADLTAARHCAIATKDPAILMMLYANGKGVKRDYRIAIRQACEMGGAMAELTGRVMHLAELRDKGAPKDPPFDQCDDITSGYMGGVCASIQATQEAKKRNARYAKVTARWPQATKSAFSTTSAVFATFVEKRSREEVDLSGTLRGAMVIEEEEKQNDRFLKDLEAFEKGALPKFTEADFRAADAKLNTAYRKIMGDAAFDTENRYGTVRKAGIRETQRAWLKYRDAWVEFAKLRYPAVKPEAWKTLSTGRRTEELEDFLPPP